MSPLVTLALVAVAGLPPQGPDLKRPRLVGFVSTTTSLIAHPQVHSELKLSAEQVTRCAEIRSRCLTKSRTFYSLKSELEGKPQLMDAAFNSYLQYELTEDLEKVLSEPQLSRFLQINLQGQGVVALADRHTQDRLAISPEQAVKIAEIKARANEELKSLLNSVRADSKSGMERYEKVRADCRGEVQAILTEDQRRRLRELEGPEFKLRPSQSRNP